jgi:hypothetical protein
MSTPEKSCGRRHLIKTRLEGLHGSNQTLRFPSLPRGNIFRDGGGGAAFQLRGLWDKAT